MTCEFWELFISFGVGVIVGGLVMIVWSLCCISARSEHMEQVIRRGRRAK